MTLANTEKLSAPATSAPASGYAVGAKVMATRNIWSAANEDSPMYICAQRGDILEVRKLGSCGWACYVAHPNREPGAMFGVEASEIKPHNVELTDAGPVTHASCETQSRHSVQ